MPIHPHQVFSSLPAYVLMSLHPPVIAHLRPCPRLGQQAPVHQTWVNTQQPTAHHTTPIHQACTTHPSSRRDGSKWFVLAIPLSNFAPCSRPNDRHTRNCSVVRTSPTPSRISAICQPQHPSRRHTSVHFPSSTRVHRPHDVRSYRLRSHGDGTGSSGRHALVHYVPRGSAVTLLSNSTSSSGNRRSVSHLDR